VVAARRSRGGAVVVDTVQAAINEAFTELQIDETKTLEMTDVPLEALDPDVVIEASRARFGDWGGSVSTTPVNLNISGSFGFSPAQLSTTCSISVTVRVAIDVHIAVPRRIEMTVQPHISATSTVTSSPGSFSLSWSKNLVGSQLSPPVFIWGPIFITHGPEVKTKVSLSGTAFHRMTTTADIGVKWTWRWVAGEGTSCSTTYDRDWTPDLDPGSNAVNFSATFTPISL
jgi:hypothetical protein